MEFMKSWITNITVVIIFTMLLDILMPNNDTKRFAKVIMGLLILLVIIKPFLMIKNIGVQFEGTMAQAAAYIESSEGEDSSNVEVFQNNTALSLYKQKLSQKITDIVRSRDDLANRKVQVTVEIENDFKKEDFGSIKSIEVLVAKDRDADVEASAIEPIKINTETVINKKADEYKWNNSKLSQDLIADINSALGLTETEILVQIQE